MGIEDYMSAVASQRSKAVGQRAEATIQGSAPFLPGKLYRSKEKKSSRPTRNYWISVERTVEVDCVGGRE